MRKEKMLNLIERLKENKIPEDIGLILFNQKEELLNIL